MRHYPLFGLLMLFLVEAWGLDVVSVFGASREVEIESIEVRFLPRSPVILLGVGERAISIFVDHTVAGSIQGALTGEKFPRPLSHDLMQSILKAYEVHVERVFITLRNGVYYGTLTLSQNGQKQAFDSRSSDAIALAVHFHSPIFVEPDLLDSEGKVLEPEGWDKKDVEL